MSPEGGPAAAVPVAVPEQEHPAALGHGRQTTGPVGASGQPSPPTAHAARTWVVPVLAVLGLAGGGYFLIPWVVTALTTVSTDDAYVNGHVTFVASRVGGQVARVLVDDNDRVKKGDLLVQLDREPFQVQLNIAQAAVTTTEANLTVAQAQARGVAGQMRSLRYSLEHAIEDVNNQVALLRSKVASLDSEKATLARAQADYDRGNSLVKSGAISKEDFDQRKQALDVAQAHVDGAIQGVAQVRVALGLPPDPKAGEGLAQVPADLDQTYSTVRQAHMTLAQAAAQLGVSDSFKISPKEWIANFYKRDAEGDIDRILDDLTKNAPAVKQAQGKLTEAQRNLDQAALNLRYCDLVSEIDGVVTRRNVNPGNNVAVGQSLMAVRSLTEVWVDANFKETQLADLRIGQRVKLDVDMYGGRREFEGRITGFTMGTGQTLALIPPQNATGNFVRIVQRLTVRIELTGYDPDKDALFVGLSVTPYVFYREPAAGPDAGQVLRPFASRPQGSSAPKP
jgi:membrane fusion protein (multidrug efflux system)